MILKPCALCNQPTNIRSSRLVMHGKALAICGSQVCNGHVEAKLATLNKKP